MEERVTTDTYQSSNQFKHTSKNWLYRRHLEAFYGKLFEVIEETGCESLLDAGCGEGFVVDYLAHRRPDLRMSGVDTNEDAISYANEHFGDKARFRAGSVYKLPFSDKSFDTVLCSEVLEHLEDPNRAVSELKRVARSFVIVTVPHEPYFQWLNSLGQFLKVAADPEHVNFWTAGTFEAFIRAHFDVPTFIRKQLYQIAVAPV